MAGMVELFVKAFVRRIADDFKHKELLPLKLLFFVHSSTVFVLYPYLTIHMRELGISVEETAIMSAVTPVVAIVMPPMAGMVADRIGNFKVLLATFSAAGGAAALLLLLVPAGRVSAPLPERAPLQLACGPSAELALRLDSAALPCESPVGPQRLEHARLEACGLACDFPAPAPAPAAGLGLGPADFTVSVSRPAPDNATDAIDYLLRPADGTDPAFEQGRESRYRSVVRELGGRLFFPAEGLVQLRCGAGGCRLGSEPDQQYQQQAPGPGPGSGELFRAQLAPGPGPGRLTVSNLSEAEGAGGPLGANCTDLLAGARIQLTVSPPPQQQPGAPPLQVRGCTPLCLATAQRPALCGNRQRTEELDVELTFWLYLAIRVFIGMIGGTAFAMFEGAVIAILREHSADYGLQRIYATIGGMISSPLSGMLIDWASRGKGYTDFRPAFYLYAGLKIASGLLILTINLEFKTPAKNVVSDVMAVLKNVELLALLAVVFVLGTAWGYLESFLFWLLQDLGGTRSLMGITITVGGIAGIPLLVLSGPIIDRFGHANVLTVGFIFYAIRLLGYSLIYNPWLCLIFEAMESVTSSLSFTAAVTYAAKLSTASTDTSVQGLLGGLYFGVGKGAGSLVGGYLMTWIGARSTYRVFACACAFVGVAYFLTHRYYLRRRPGRTRNDIVKIKSTFLGGPHSDDKAKPEPTDGDREKPAPGPAAGAESEKSGAGDAKATESRPINKNEAEKNAWNTALSHAADGVADALAEGSCRVNLAYEADAPAETPPSASTPAGKA